MAGVPTTAHCDDPVLPVVSAPVVIDWDPVTASHPTLGKPGAVAIDRYQLFVEVDDVEFGLNLTPDMTEFEIPQAILDVGSEFKFEIIARTESGNNTAFESCFELQ